MKSVVRQNYKRTLGLYLGILSSPPTPNSSLLGSAGVVGSLESYFEIVVAFELQSVGFARSWRSYVLSQSFSNVLPLFASAAIVLLSGGEKEQNYRFWGFF